MFPVRIRKVTGIKTIRLYNRRVQYPISIIQSNDKNSRQVQLQALICCQPSLVVALTSCSCGLALSDAAHSPRDRKRSASNSAHHSMRSSRTYWRLCGLKKHKVRLASIRALKASMSGVKLTMNPIGENANLPPDKTMNGTSAGSVSFMPCHARISTCQSDCST